MFAQDEAAHLALALTTWPSAATQGNPVACLFPAVSPEAAEGGQPAPPGAGDRVLSPGTLAAMLGWQRLARRELELVELPAHSRPGDQRLLSILNAHLGLLCFA
jgi:hypothetical protein